MLNYIKTRKFHKFNNQRHIKTIKGVKRETSLKNPITRTKVMKDEFHYH